MGGCGRWVLIGKCCRRDGVEVGLETVQVLLHIW